MAITHSFQLVLGQGAPHAVVALGLPLRAERGGRGRQTGRARAADVAEQVVQGPEGGVRGVRGGRQLGKAARLQPVQPTRLHPRLGHRPAFLAGSRRVAKFLEHGIQPLLR